MAWARHLNKVKSRQSFEIFGFLYIKRFRAREGGGDGHVNSAKRFVWLSKNVNDSLALYNCGNARIVALYKFISRRNNFIFSNESSIIVP